MEMVTVGRVHLPLSELVSYSELMPGPETGTRITAQEAVTWMQWYIMMANIMNWKPVTAEQHRDIILLRKEIRCFAFMIRWWDLVHLSVWRTTYIRWYFGNPGNLSGKNSYGNWGSIFTGVKQNMWNNPSSGYDHKDRSICIFGFWTGDIHQYSGQCKGNWNRCFCTVLIVRELWMHRNWK